MTLGDKISKGCIAPSLNTRYPVPNARAADKEIITFYIPRTLAVRLRKMARKRGETLTDLCISIWTRETKHIELSPEDYQAIADATRLAQSGQRRTTKVFNKNPRPPRAGGKAEN